MVTARQLKLWESILLMYWKIQSNEGVMIEDATDRKTKVSSVSHFFDVENSEELIGPRMSTSNEIEVSCVNAVAKASLFTRVCDRHDIMIESHSRNQVEAFRAVTTPGDWSTAATPGAVDINTVTAAPGWRTESRHSGFGGRHNTLNGKLRVKCSSRVCCFSRAKNILFIEGRGSAIRGLHPG